jgi:hypothetical protein
MPGVTKKMQLLAYIVSKHNKLTTYPKLVEFFVRKG